MSKTILENSRAEAFFSIYGVDSQKEILEQFKRDIVEFKNIKNDDELKEMESSRIFSKYALAITFMYSLATIKNNLKAYKKIITELRAGEIFQKKFYFEGLYTTVSKATEKKVIERKESNKTMPFEVVAEIKRVKKILDNNSFKVLKNQDKKQVRSYYIAYILGLSTGRRFTEILKTIKVHKKDSEFKFIGLLKKKDSLKSQHIKAHILELSFKDVQDFLSELRAYLKVKLAEKKITLEDATESDINRIFSKVYNNAVLRISAKKVKNFHELRHFYTIAFQDIYLAQNPHLSDNSEQELSVILQDVRYTILGHEIKDDTTSTYITFK